MNTLFIIKRQDAQNNIISEEKMENVARVTAMIRFLEIVEDLKSNKELNSGNSAILLDAVEDRAVLSFKLTENNF